MHDLVRKCPLLLLRHVVRLFRPVNRGKSRLSRKNLIACSSVRDTPTTGRIDKFLARSRGTEPGVILDHSVEQEGEEAVRHPFLMPSGLMPGST